MSAPDLWAAGALPRALFEQSPFSTVVYDAEGHPLAVNPAFTALWGGVTLAAVPAGYTVLADAQLAEQGALPLIRRAFAGEHVVTPPVRFDMAKVATTGAGRTIWTQGYWYPVRDDAGRLTHVVLVHADITERIQAEQAIREAEGRLRLAQQVGHIGTFDWHVPSGRVAWTEEEERIFGLAPGTFEGTIEGWARRVLPEDLDRMQRGMADAMARGVREMDFTFRIRRADGEVREIEGRGAFLYAPDGAPERMVGVNVDVTDRRRAEDELARGDRALRAAVERTTRLQAVTAAFGRALTAEEIARVTLDEGLAALGAQAAVVYLASDDGTTLAVAASRGLPEQALRPWATLPVDAPMLVAEAVRVGAPLYAPDRAATLARYPSARDANRLVAEEAWAAVPLLQGGRTLGALALGFAEARAFPAEERAFLELVAQQCAQALERARLYEAERAARRAAEASAGRLAALQGATAELTAALTPGEVVDAVLRAGLPAVGATRGSVALLAEDGAAVEVTGAVGYPEALLAAYRCFPIDAPFPLADAVRTGEAIFLPSGGARAERYPHLEALRSDNGAGAMATLPLRAGDRVFGALGMNWAEEHAFPEEERGFLRSLAEQCAQALERARLYEEERHARTEAEQASRAKSDFLAAMSHELRTPLNGIGGYVELMEMGIRGPVTAAQRADLDRIRRNQRHLLALIEDVLSFARVEAGRLEVDRVPVPLGETLESLEALVLPQMAAQGLRFTHVPCDPALAALGDRERIVQVCVNLLTNAAKATPSGGSVTLWCEAGDGDSGDGAVRVRVRDTGVGIPADKLESIFSPFTQLGRTLSNPRAGAGLGLSIARGLAEAMGGSLTVESEVGRGSTFTLTLQRA